MFYNEELTEYLNSIQQRLMEEKIELDRVYADICNHVLENKKFVSLLDESNNPNFESFTPRDVNAKNKEKINILIQEKKELENEGTSIKAKIEDIIFEQDKLKKIIQKNRETMHEKKTEENEQESLVHIISRLNQYYTDLRIKEEKSQKEKISALIHRVELCTHIFFVDKMRCKMELDNLKDDLLELDQTMDEDYQNQKLSLNEYLKKLSERVHEKFSNITVELEIRDDTYNEDLQSDEVIDDKKKSLIKSMIDSYFYEKLKSSGEQQSAYVYHIALEPIDGKIQIVIKVDGNIDFSMIL